MTRILLTLACIAGLFSSQPAMAQQPISLEMTARCYAPEPYIAGTKSQGWEPSDAGVDIHGNLVTLWRNGSRFTVTLTFGKSGWICPIFGGAEWLSRKGHRSSWRKS